MFVLKAEHSWYRSFSPIKEPIIFPKGTIVVPVPGVSDYFWISSKAATLGSILNHDLAHYGCRVHVSLVEEING